MLASTQRLLRSALSTGRFSGGGRRSGLAFGVAVYGGGLSSGAPVVGRRTVEDSSPVEGLMLEEVCGEVPVAEE